MSIKPQTLSGFNVDKKEIVYKNSLDWFVEINDIEELWRAQPTYLIAQAVFLLGGLLTFVHAYRKGGRWPWLWWATVVHGLIVDNVWHFVIPEMDNFWHSRTPLMLLGGRLPLHIILLYPFFIYNAAYAVSKLKLPFWSEPFAVGLVTVLIDIPYDIVSVKFLHWTWHDTDPNIIDRHYWVPWNSYFFHATFTASLFYFFQAVRGWLAPKVNKWTSAGFFTEFKAFVGACILGMPGGVLFFSAIYNPLHDIYGIHSEVTFFILFSIFSVFIISGLLTQREPNNERGTAIDYSIFLHLVIHYLIYWAFTIWGHPEREISIGLHEPVGNCKDTVRMKTVLGTDLIKRKYLCLEDYNEEYFDFSCLPGGRRPTPGSVWYTACGTPFRNRAEYIAILSTILFVALNLFYRLHFKTSDKTSNQKKDEGAKKGKSKRE